MAAGYPNIQAGFTGAPPPPSKQQPQIQSPMGALLGGRSAMPQFGGALSPLIQAALRKKSVMDGFDLGGQGAGYFPQGGERGPDMGRQDMLPQAGMEDIRTGDKPYGLQYQDPQGFDPERNIRKQYPGLYPLMRQPGEIEREMKGDWLPSETAQRVSQGAMGLRGFGGPMRRMGGGQGFGEGGSMDVLKRLLMQGGGF